MSRKFSPIISPVIRNVGLDRELHHLRNSVWPADDVRHSRILRVGVRVGTLDAPRIGRSPVSSCPIASRRFRGAQSQYAGESCRDAVREVQRAKSASGEAATPSLERQCASSRDAMHLALTTVTFVFAKLCSFPFFFFFFGVKQRRKYRVDLRDEGQVFT